MYIGLPKKIVIRIELQPKPFYKQVIIQNSLNIANMLIHPNTTTQ